LREESRDSVIDYEEGYLQEPEIGTQSVRYVREKIMPYSINEERFTK